MAKKSRKRLQKSQKNHAGCMSGLINMFDLRQGHSSTKLLSDSKHRSGRHFGTQYMRNKLDSPSKFKDKQKVDDVQEGCEEIIDVAMTTIKTLMEEEISRLRPSKKIPTEEIGRIRSELGLDVHLDKNCGQAATSFEIVSDIVNDQSSPTCLEAQQSNCASTAEKTSPNFDLAALMIKLYDDNHHCQEKHVDFKSKNDKSPVSKTIDHGKHIQVEEPCSKLSEKQIVIHKALFDVANVFLSQNSPTAELTGAVHSQEFIDALEILSTNKELLVRLLQDPKFKQIQDDQNVQAGKKSNLESGNYPGSCDVVEGIGSSRQFDETINQKMLNKLSRYSLFRKMNKSKGRRPSTEGNDSHAMNTIVVLKPGPSRFMNTSIPISPGSSPRSHHILKSREDGEKGVSHLSFKEIKRRLKHVVSHNTKEPDVILRDGVFHRVSLVSTDSSATTQRDSLTSKTYYNTEFTSESSVSRRDKKVKLKHDQENMKNESNFHMHGNDKRRNMTATAHPLTRKSFYEEAKRHLGQMLNTRHHEDITQTTEVSKPLGFILSLPKSNISPKSSPRRDNGQDLSLTHQYQEDDSDHLSRLMPDSDETSCSGDNSDNVFVISSNPEFIDTQIEEGICPVEDVNHKGSKEIVEDANTISIEESDWLDANSKSEGSEHEVADEKRIEEGSPVQSELGPLEDGSPQTPCLSFSFDYLLGLHTLNPESISEKPERASPVSVLEPLFAEDVNQTGSEQDMHNEHPLCSRNINFEEHDNPVIVVTLSDSEANSRTTLSEIAGRFEYIRAVLELSGLSCDEISTKWHSSDKLLDPSLFDEVEILYSKLSDDPALLFDCINEELGEIQERFFTCSPWISFIRRSVRPVPVGENLIQKVCSGIERHLEWESPRTLDQIVQKDMDGGTWINVQPEIESMIIEIGDDVLDEVMVELALAMWL